MFAILKYIYYQRRACSWMPLISRWEWASLMASVLPGSTRFSVQGSAFELRRFHWTSSLSIPKENLLLRVRFFGISWLRSPEFFAHKHRRRERTLERSWKALNYLAWKRQILKHLRLSSRCSKRFSNYLISAEIRPDYWWVILGSFLVGKFSTRDSLVISSKEILSYGNPLFAKPPDGPQLLATNR